VSGKLRKILIIQPYKNIGGPQQVMYRIVRQLHGERYHFSVIMPGDGPAAGQFRALGVEVTFIPEATAFYRTANPLKLLLFAVRLIVSTVKVRAYIRANGIDLVHSTTAQCLVGGLAARLAGVPSIYHVHDLTLASPRIVGILLSRMITLSGDRVLFVSEAALRTFPLPPGESHKEQVVHNGVDIGEFRPGMSGRNVFLEFGLDHEQPIVMAIGALERRKGQDILIRAAGQVCQFIPNTAFLFVGEVHPYSIKNGYEAEVQRLILELGLTKNVLFLGPQEHVNQLLCAADVVVQPSLVEAGALVPLEAMACGKPVVGTEVGGIPEEIEDGVTGLLVPPNDPGALAEAILCLLRDEKLRKEMGTAGRWRMERLFTMQQQGKAMACIYDELILQEELRRG
jgi:glycosyltransferase involved in cell wall biosynthesis